jgi:hypothetical protein
MRFFSQFELEDWSQKLGGHFRQPYMINPLYPKELNPNLYKISTTFDDYTKIDYKFTFSISKNNVERFNNLISQFLNEGFEISNLDNKFHIERLTVDDVNNLNSFRTITEHKTYGVDFIRYTYDFNKVMVLPLMMFVQTIQDAIEIIGNFWSFNQQGEEICQIKYPPGSIVSLKNDRGDFIIESVQYLRKNTKSFEKLKLKFNIKDELIIYNLIKIISNHNSQVLEYDSAQYKASADGIIPNRGQRLDELLDN